MNLKQINNEFHLTDIIFTIIFSSLFIFLLINFNNQFFQNIDYSIYQFFLHHQNIYLQNFFIFFTNLFSPIIFIILFISLLTVLIYYKRFFYFIIAFITIPILIIFQTILKYIIHRPRPEIQLYHASAYSFPSAHSATASLFFFIIIFAFSQLIKNKLYKIIFICTNFILITIIVISRLYLTVHWFTDVIAGISLGLAFFFLTLTIIKFIIDDYKEKLELLKDAWDDFSIKHNLK